jgi:hypothetical protein
VISEQRKIENKSGEISRENGESGGNTHENGVIDSHFVVL